MFQWTVGTKTIVSDAFGNVDIAVLYDLNGDGVICDLPADRVIDVESGDGVIRDLPDFQRLIDDSHSDTLS
jgi:hypothetical protein